MVTLTKIGEDYNADVMEISGLSTDKKPIGVFEGRVIINGSTYKEINTGRSYTYNAESKTWHLNNTSSQSSGSSSGADVINLYVCSDGEYTPDGSPTITRPDGETTYLVPQDDEGFLYASWVYTNGAWEFVDTLSVTLDEPDTQDKPEGGNDLPAAAKPVFFLKGLPGSVDNTEGGSHFSYYDDPNRCATVEEIVDAYMAGNAYVVTTHNNMYTAQPSKITRLQCTSKDGSAVYITYFYISSEYSFYISGSKVDDYTAAMAKYFP